MVTFRNNRRNNFSENIEYDINAAIKVSLMLHDSISIIDENGIIDNDCGSNNGPVSLGSGIIEEVGVNNILRMNPIQTKIGVNHCSVGAGG